MINYTDDTITLNNKTYQLDDVRAYLLEKHPTLCKNHFIKTIIKKGNPFFSYDWQSVIEIAINADYFSESSFKAVKPKAKEETTTLINN